MEEAYPGGRAVVDQAFRLKGYLTEALKIAQASVTEATMKQYNSCYKLWWNFCKQHSVDIYKCQVPGILAFFVELYQNRGYSFGSLNCARAALYLICLTNFSSDPNVKRFFKGVQNLRPSTPKYDFTWNPDTVLNHLSQMYPNDSLLLKPLSFKLVTLLALVTAHRVQTISLIKLKNIIKRPSGFELWMQDPSV